MSTLNELRAVVDGILEADEVTAVDGEYRVERADGFICRIRCNDRGDWAAYFESGMLMPSSPTGYRPNELVIWALL